MSKLLYVVVGLIAKIHSAILTWNDSCETVLSDKQLHFLVIGVIGMMMLFVIFPLFKALSKNHVLVIAWIYVFTVMVVLTFAIEIGQGITHTGTMDFDDIVFGLVGFMVMFLIFAVIRSIILSVVKMVKSMF